MFEPLAEPAGRSLSAIPPSRRLFQANLRAYGIPCGTFLRSSFPILIISVPDIPIYRIITLQEPKQPSGKLLTGDHMPYRGSEFIKDQYYHIYNRGAGKRPIFFNTGNYEHLIHLIKHYSLKYSITIIAYCLMPNHYHFLLRQKTDIPLSKFIGVLFNAYAQAVNQQQERSGALFEGRFQHICVDRYEYLIQLCRYIHNNPLKAGLVTRLEDWPYSNYLDWVGLRNGTLKDDEFLQHHFPEPALAYREFVNDLKDEADRIEVIENYILD
jgi:putative transposase